MADYLTHDQWTRRTPEELSRDRFRQKIKRETRKSLPNQGEQPVTNRLDVNNLPAGYKVVKRDPQSGGWCCLLRRTI